MTSDHTCLFLTLCIGYRLALVLVQICLILGVHLNEQPLALSPARGTKGHGGIMHWIMELIPECGIVTGHLVIWPSLYRGARNYRLVGRATDNSKLSITYHLFIGGPNFLFYLASCFNTMYCSLIFPAAL